MGRKHKHSKDKLYKTVSELTSRHVGEDRDIELSALHRRLKFDSCCLSLTTVTHKPMGLSDSDGYCYVFDCDLIIEFLEKFNQIHPITGQKVTAKDLFELKFHMNEEEHYHCPVTLKVFNQHSKIVANRKTGHVYSYQAFHDMNVKANYFKDLMTDEPFIKSDILTLQDPDLASKKWNVTEFYYIKNKLKLNNDSSESKIRDMDNQSRILKSSLEEYRKKSDEIVATFNKIVGNGVVQTESNKEKLDKINSAAYSDGKLSSSVTSTVMPVTQNQQAALLSEEQIIYPRIKKKAHVQLLTNFGPINLELFCDRTPKTCHNFLMLITRKYYDGTVFHRLIKNFIMQGGDPTGTGSGGQSAWGKPFEDEIRGDLKHVGRGVLAMANSGPNTNKSQFYITLRGTWDHLDRKHTVFGRVVGGISTLEKIEAEVETDKNDRPKSEIKIIQARKFDDPYEEVQAAIDAERSSATSSQTTRERGQKRAHEHHEALVHQKKTNAPNIAPPASTVDANQQVDVVESIEPGGAGILRKPTLKSNPLSGGSKKSTFGNFDNW